MKARSAKRKGTKLEKEVVDLLNRIGVPARRQPGSGIYQDFPHDVEIQLGGGHETVRLIVECKSWKNGWLTGDKAMGKADLLVIKRDRAEECYYMPRSTFMLLAHATHAYFSVEAQDEETLQALAELDFEEGVTLPDLSEVAGGDLD